MIRICYRPAVAPRSEAAIVVSVETTRRRTMGMMNQETRTAPAVHPMDDELVFVCPDRDGTGFVPSSR